MSVFKFYPVQHSSDFPLVFARIPYNQAEILRYFTLRHDDGLLISPAPTPNVLCLCLDLRVCAHSEIDEE